MKLEVPKNANYAAVVVQVKTIIDLPNCDNLVAIPLIGYTAIVGKDVKVGDIGIVFPPETQLSEKFCYENNLCRHTDRNKDVLKKGYLEDSRRVKAIKFRGNVSNALFLHLDSLAYTGINLRDLKEGMTFDKINTCDICQKYVIKVNEPRLMQKKIRIERVEPIHMPEHFDTDNYFRYKDDIDPETEVIITQKIHGTSIRVGNTIVRRKFNLIEKALKGLGIKIQPTEYDYIYASRKVIKDPNNPFQNDFYETDIWTDEGRKIQGLLPENYILYGELVGWTSTGRPIQKDYTYCQPECVAKLYVYRVAIVNPSGILTELSWDHTVEFCKTIGVETVKELWRGKHKDFVAEDYLDKKLIETYPQCIDCGPLVDEGVCVRIDSLHPKIYKAKSPIFLEHETKLLDEGVVDTESTQIV